MATIFSGWARARLDNPEASLLEMRQALADHIEHGNRAWVPIFQGLLADIEAEVEGAKAALERIDKALALVAETGEHWTDSFLYRIRGQIFLKHDPANAAAAESAFLTAIAVAQEQKAKSFELHAALSLAKLYQSTGRSADAHAVLAPALEGFAPTPEFPDIEEAETLLDTLS